MKQTFTVKEKIVQLWKLFLPILITQLAMLLMNFFDTTMSGHFSKADLAGVAIGSSLWFPISTGLGTILQAVTPITAHLIGSKKTEEIPFTLIQSIYASASMAVFVIACGAIVLDPVLGRMNLEPHVETVARHFLWALSCGLIPLFCYQVCRSLIDATGLTKISMLITLLSLPINIAFNYLFIFGHAGFPRLGGAGAGVAGAITYWIIFVIAVIVLRKLPRFGDMDLFRSFYPVSFRKWKELFSLGIPMGLSTFFESSIFSVVTLFMSKFGTDTIASHQAAMNFESLLYMLPLSISLAMIILVGFEAGAGRFRDARTYSTIGIITAIIMATMTGFLLYLFHKEVAAFYSDDPDVIRLTGHFLLYAIFFQWSDAVQAPVQGALRGYKDVRITTVMTFVSYWVIGLPLGFLLNAVTSLGPFAYWIGLISGLAAGAVALLSRLFFLQRKYMGTNKKAV
ncbi:putative multidrug resistance protein NorM [Weizmannia acidilactici]|uniref:Probable multidrug resistance protein NorM n=1 Tax=Weizmannia acidilactici TaxID=2607726 RepID=A0A5J4JRG8_9BACI|nr:MATE family efflux transporter [Weizmannia acidilactici]GER68526.1 putative multidrug resistance protein NorM [Weizmannia acidilactici]GER71704.1 putative multidrug resistance protein NorM [Weizmannia acidilactici]GER75021.1 putative multidrug resistance protein NorM [Weizmannia acidilactici]